MNDKYKIEQMIKENKSKIINNKEIDNSNNV